jgi:hypothetical protein
MTAPATISATRLMELLTPTLGWDKSSEVVSVALARRGLSHGELSLDDALTLLEVLSGTAGMVGIAARYAATRVQSLRATSSAAPPSRAESARGGPSSSPGSQQPSSAGSRSSATTPPSSAAPQSSTLRSADATAPPVSGSGDMPSSSRARPVAVDLRDIVELFEGAMGRERSEEVVFAAARRLSLPTERLDKAHALSLLDTLVSEPGIVGLCARFAKARLILRFAA